MNSRYLFPHYFKRIGWLLTIPTMVIGLLMMFSNLNLSFMEISIHKDTLHLFAGDYNDLSDELLSILLIIGLNLIAFSKEKIEDEWVSKIRLESLQWGVYINSFILILATLFVYELNYLTVMTFNMFTVLIFFIIRFNYLLYIKPSFSSKNKVNAF
jgi:hypothetical protein